MQRVIWWAALLAGAAWAADPEAGVARSLAVERAAALRGVRYELSLGLEAGAREAAGRVAIRFRGKPATGPLVVDYRGGATGAVIVNGAAAGEVRRVNGHLLVPAEGLREGENTVEIPFTTGVDTAGLPLIRYRDRDDGSEYIYTLFVPMDASMAFPCFDQPDLKGRFSFSLTVPAGWTAVSNGAVTSEAAAGPARRFVFAETPPISTYLFAFAAGPFAELTGEPGGAVPHRLLFRKSKATRAREEWPEVLRITSRGLDHLAAFFATPFPFAKYDQVVLPGLAYGGMEHAGATFLNEDSILFRTVPTPADRTRRALLLLHELCHQWFGDLVTMRWFDDLWLKEGFATYMAYHALAAQEPPERVWKHFAEVVKSAAYAIDSTPGTTPIHQEIRNLADAKSAYGAIVYNKAPALLRYLSYTVGETAFRDGLRLYLRRYAWGNATWEDLIAAVSKTSGRPLGRWATSWVGRRGMPEIRAEWACAAGRLTSLTLTQRDTLDEGGVWPLRSRLLLTATDGRERHLDWTLDGVSAPLPAARGEACPAWVYLNEGDPAYGRFLLDPVSRAAIVSSLGEVRDPLLRSQLWSALWEDVRRAALPPGEFLALALRLLPAEQDETLSTQVLSRAATAYQEYLGEEARLAIRPALEALVIDRLRTAPAPALRIAYFRELPAIASGPAAIEVLRELLDGRNVPAGIEVRPADRWRMITALVALDAPGAQALLSAETARDKTDDGARYAWVAGAAAPSAAVKARYFADYRDNRQIPESWVQASLPAFHHWTQSNLTAPYLRPSLEMLSAVKRDRKIFFVLAWLNAFLGGQRSAEALETVDRFLAAPGLDADLRGKVLQVREDLARKVRIRGR